jgi:hypothetical protein
VIRDLQHQALPEIAGGHPDRVELLYSGQRAIHSIYRNGERLRDVFERAGEESILVDVANNLFGDPQLPISVAVGLVELLKQMAP